MLATKFTALAFPLTSALHTYCSEVFSRHIPASVAVLREGEGGGVGKGEGWGRAKGGEGGGKRGYDIDEWI